MLAAWARLPCSMGDVLQFPKPGTRLLEPWWPQSWEVNCVVVYNFLGWEVPRYQHLSVFEHKWLDHLHGYRHREVYDHLNADRERRDREITMKLYGACKIENVRWP